MVARPALGAGAQQDVWVRVPSSLHSLSGLKRVVEIQSIEVRLEPVNPDKMRQWRNGRRATLRGWSGQPGMGSSPICRTVPLVDGDFQHVVAAFLHNGTVSLAV